jgi:hypothetical protein
MCAFLGMPSVKVRMEPFASVSSLVKGRLYLYLPPKRSSLEVSMTQIVKPNEGEEEKWVSGGLTFKKEQQIAGFAGKRK